MSTFSFGLVIHDNWEVQGLGVGILNWPGSSFAWLTWGTHQGSKAGTLVAAYFFNRFVTVCLSKGLHACPGHAEVKSGAFQNLRLIPFCNDHSSPAALRA